jgi:hypothetical protein
MSPSRMFALRNLAYLRFYTSKPYLPGQRAALFPPTIDISQCVRVRWGPGANDVCIAAFLGYRTTAGWEPEAKSYIVEN